MGMGKGEMGKGGVGKGKGEAGKGKGGEGWLRQGPRGASPGTSMENGKQGTNTGSKASFTIFSF